MIISGGKPNELVRMAFKKQFGIRGKGKTNIVNLFTFDKNGKHEGEYDKKIIDRLKNAGYIVSEKKIMTRKCKYCGEKFENQGFLLQHYKICDKK